MKRHATAIWKGALGDGTGAITTQSGALSDHGYSFKARFEDESGKSGTNPEELLAAAHAGCFAMQLSHLNFSISMAIRSTRLDGRASRIVMCPALISVAMHWAGSTGWLNCLAGPPR